MSHKLKVVVVDDEKQITELLASFLPLVGQAVEVRTFNDSIVAKEFIAHNPVDLLITDYKMPQFDGLQLIESAPPQVRKVMLSGYLSEIAQDKLRAPNTTFFEKPVPLRALAKVISEQQKQIQ